MAAAAIAKAILGAIGGGFEGAAKPYSNGNPLKTSDFKTEIKADENKGNKELQEHLDKKNALNETNAGETFDLQSKFKVDNGGYSKPFGMNIGNIGTALGSDERLKEIYGDSISDRIIEDFARIAAIDFTYNDKAKALYGKESGVDDKEHTGVKAQDLEQTDTTKAVVEEDDNGFKKVDTEQLTMTNTAAISELARRVLTLETAIKELMGKQGA